MRVTLAQLDALMIVAKYAPIIIGRVDDAIVCQSTNGSMQLVHPDGHLSGYHPFNQEIKDIEDH